MIAFKSHHPFQVSLVEVFLLIICYFNHYYLCQSIRKQARAFERLSWLRVWVTVRARFACTGGKHIVIHFFCYSSMGGFFNGSGYFRSWYGNVPVLGLLFPLKIHAPQPGNTLVCPHIFSLLSTVGDSAPWWITICRKVILHWFNVVSWTIDLIRSIVLCTVTPSSLLGLLFLLSALW
jgi:hypothetical protein